MLKVRLQRTGKRGQAYFRVVVVEHTKKPKGEFLELLGSYNPHEKQFQVKKERIEYWVSQGAQVTPTVNNLMVNYKVWDKPKMQSWKPKPSSRAQAEGKKEAQATEAPAEAPKTEAPAEAAPAEPAAEAASS